MQKENNQTALGGFETAEELLRAYEELKAEYEKTKTEPEKVEENDDEWQEKIAVFTEKHPNAKKYFPEIGKILMENGGELDDNALEIAYIKLLEGHKTPEEIIHDDDFLENYVYVSEKIKDRIISDYLAEINAKTPNLMQGGGQTFVTPPMSPRNLSEAMKLAEKLLSK